MNKEELYGCYIATKNITSEDEWNKITDKLISLGFGEAGVDRGFKCIKSWPQLSIEKDDRFLLRCEGTGSKEIKISDILGEETKFEVGKYYSYIWNWGNVGKCICKVSKVTEVQMKAEWDYTVSGKSFRTPGVGATNLHEISDIKELTLEEIQQYLPDNHPDKIAKEFTLPKKWYIQATGENQKVVGAWLMKNDYQPNINDLDKGGYTDWYFKYPRGGDYSGSEKEPSEDYMEITFEQFKQYVLKEPKSLTVDNLVEGEIYYCENTYLTGGRHGYVFLKNGDNGIKHLVIEGLKFLKKGWSFWTDKDTINLRLATSEEKHWLLTCIKQDKFIPKEDLSKYDSEGDLIEVISKPETKEMQLSDLKNPVFNVGDKVRVIADSLREFNNSWTDGNNTGYKKGYVGIITDIGSTSNYEVNAWCYLEDSVSGISRNLLELVEPAKSKVNRNVYYEVETQEQYNEILDWLESKGEVLNESARKLQVNITWKYVVFNLGISGSWALYYEKKDLLKAEFQFKDKPETQPIKTGIGLSEQILQYPYQYVYKTIDLSSAWEALMNPSIQNSRAELKQEPIKLVSFEEDDVVLFKTNSVKISNKQLIIND